MNKFLNMTALCFVIALTHGAGQAQTTAVPDAAANPAPKSPHHTHFATPDDAAIELMQAMRDNNKPALRAILGAEASHFIQPKDPLLFNSARVQLLKSYDEQSRIEWKGRHLAILHVGNDDWPFPFPIVNRTGAWYFDTRAGIQEWKDRRVGANELATIKVLLAYVDAQRDFAHMHQSHNELLEYAQHIYSKDGQHDGLYWPQKEGEPLSPLGMAFASASKAGSVADHLELTPYHGYFYRILTRQGPSAFGGKLDYVVDGKMIGGFAMIAYPAEYGESGFKTFIVNHDGQVYSKDLGKQTIAGADAITAYDPDSSWKKEQQQ